MRRSRWRGPLCAVLGSAAVLTCGAAAPVPAAVPVPVAVPVPGERVTAVSAAALRGDPGSVPVRLLVPALGVDAPVRAVATDPRGELGVPDDPQVVGWWAAGGAPGLPGAAGVLDGHVDSAALGPGALFHLAALGPGDVLSVVTADGATTPYVVRELHRFPKTAFRADLLAPGGAPRLVVVTCGGLFDRATRHYADNVVVVASPVQ